MGDVKLTVTDMGGAHNSDLDASRARLIQGGSWKKQRIIVIIPAGEMIPATVALTHWNLMFPPNNGVIRILAQGCEVGEAYSAALDGVLNDPNLREWEYVLTLEHDNTPPADGVLKLLERMESHPEMAAISGAYWTKGAGGVFQGWGDASDPVLNFRPQLPRADGGMQEVNGIGMGFALFRMSMFRDIRLRRPWFKTQTEGGVSTQDLYFCSNAKSFGYRFGVDTSVRVGHYDHSGDFGLPRFAW